MIWYNELNGLYTLTLPLINVFYNNQSGIFTKCGALTIAQSRNGNYSTPLYITSILYDHILHPIVVITFPPAPLCFTTNMNDMNSTLPTKGAYRKVLGKEVENDFSSR